MRGSKKTPPGPTPPPPPGTPSAQKAFIQDRVPALFDLPVPEVAKPEEVRFILSSKIALAGPQMTSIQGRRLEDRLERSKIRYAIENREGANCGTRGCCNSMEGAQKVKTVGPPTVQSGSGAIILTSRIRKPMHRKPDWSLYDEDVDGLKPRHSQPELSGAVLKSAVRRPGSEIPQRLPEPPPEIRQDTPRTAKSKSLTEYFASPAYLQRLEEANKTVRNQ